MPGASRSYTSTEWLPCRRRLRRHARVSRTRPNLARVGTRPARIEDLQGQASLAKSFIAPTSRGLTAGRGFLLLWARPGVGPPRPLPLRAWVPVGPCSGRTASVALRLFSRPAVLRRGGAESALTQRPTWEILSRPTLCPFGPRGEPASVRTVSCWGRVALCVTMGRLDRFSGWKKSQPPPRSR